MTLELGFAAETPEEAQGLAEQWISAEPNVESGDVVSVARSEWRASWTVTVHLVLRGGDQQTLGLGA